mmetsp:Transcript_25584/g.59421  ORF Transcript_25584/g.59421 Transcript_25584/m.59421 type:complete len:217 (-) Transcript_25584:425-1075(-)
MPPGCIVTVEVDGSPLEACRFLWQPFAQKLVQHLTNSLVLSGWLGHVNIASTIAEQAHSVRLHPFRILRHDIHSRDVAGKCPCPKHVLDFGVFNASFLPLDVLKDSLGTAIGHQSVRSHLNCFKRSFLQLEVCDLQIASFGQLTDKPSHDRQIYSCELRIVLNLSAVDRLVSNVPTDHLDKPMLVVVAPIDRKASQCQRLTDCLGLAVLLIPQVAL